MGVLAAPFFMAGSLKIAYDLVIYQTFKDVRPPEEAARRAVGGVVQSSASDLE